jgi:hypothetical protein
MPFLVCPKNDVTDQWFSWGQPSVCFDAMTNCDYIDSRPLWEGSRRLRLFHCSSTVAWRSRSREAQKTSFSGSGGVSERRKKERENRLCATVLLQWPTKRSRSQLKPCQRGPQSAIPCITLRPCYWTVSLWSGAKMARRACAELCCTYAVADLQEGWVGSSPLMTWFTTKNTVAKTSNHR